MSIAQCIGCGYCCRKAPCAMAVRIYGRSLTGPCPELVYHDDRWWCRAIENARGPLRDHYEQDVAIGGGCSSSMFNQDREHIPTPFEIEKRAELSGQVEGPLDYKRAFEIVCKQISGQFMLSGDGLWLVMHELETKMGKRARNAFVRAVRENRDKHTNEMMGEMPEVLEAVPIVRPDA